MNCASYKLKEKQFLKYSKKGTLTAKQKEDLKFEYFKTQFKIMEKKTMLLLKTDETRKRFSLELKTPILTSKKSMSISNYFELGNLFEAISALFFLNSRYLCIAFVRFHCRRLVLFHP